MILWTEVAATSAVTEGTSNDSAEAKAEKKEASVKEEEAEKTTTEKIEDKDKGEKEKNGDDKTEKTEKGNKLWLEQWVVGYLIDQGYLVKSEDP